MHSPLALDTPGRAPGHPWWVAVALAAAILFALPFYLDIALQLDLSIILILSLLALSMSFIWGYVGMLSFGQTVFFTLGGYSYAIVAMNTGSTGLGVLAALVIPTLFAAVLGYFTVYGRISDIYFSVITLVVTLILEKGLRSTSGPEYVIGTVRLNGQNGIPGVPSLRLPWNPSVELGIEGVFWLAAGTLIAVYIGLRLLLASHFGHVLVGIRENERRIELLGYDSRKFKLSAFVLSSGLAALAGILYAAWGNFVAPEMANLNQAAQVVIWVVVGGRTTLVGPILGTGIVQYLTVWLGTQGIGQVNLVLGAILILFVLAFREGLVPTIDNVLAYVLRRRPELRALGLRSLLRRRGGDADPLARRRT